MVNNNREKIQELIEKYKGLIEVCWEGNITQDQINKMGKSVSLANKETFQLIIPNDENTPEHGEFFINSIQGHYCYSTSDISVHTYHVLEGDGIFIIGGNEVPVKPGDTITITPKTEYTYMGRMLLVEEMEPNFIEKYEHEGRKVNYDATEEKQKGAAK